MNFIRNCGQKCWYWLMGLTLVMAWFLVIFAGYVMLYPFNPITFNDEQFPIITEEVIEGEPIVFEIDSCKHMDIAPKVQVSYIDGIIFDTPLVQTNKGLGCEVARVSQIVPDKLPLGEYQLRIIFHYHIYGFRDVTYTKYSESFEIIK